MLNRRGLFIAAGAIGVVGAGVGLDSAPVRRRLGWTGEDGTVPDVAPGDVWAAEFDSTARGQKVSMAVMTPAGADRGALPVCLVLHGRSGSARAMVDLGLPRFVAFADRPLALVAVDGGTDSYWISRRAGDDPQAMLREELPGWLAAAGFGVPGAVLGVSMGGFGSLVHARQRELKAVALLSPALFRSWSDASTVDAFADERAWAAAEPLRHVSELPADLKLGVWCGREDPFHDAAADFADRVRPEVASFGHGAHTAGYWHRVLPEALRFIGDHA